MIFDSSSMYHPIDFIILSSFLLQGCMLPELVGDGYCHDLTNNVHCGFDGGDCCGSSCVNTDHCTDCECLTGVKRGITNALVGDGYCHDHLNNAECQFDAGDCCGACINTDYCKDCACISSSSIIGTTNALVGDGICHDEFNNAQCMFDEFDCCKGNVSTTYCSECSCKGKRPHQL